MKNANSCFLSALFRIVLFLVAAFVSAATEKTIVFVHVNIVNSDSGTVESDRTVVIENSRIETIGESSKVRIPKNAEVIESNGKFMIPGLWDMHVHWYDADYLPLFIANGVTGVRLMWGIPKHHQWRKEIEKGKMLGPHLLIASTIMDGPNPVWPGSISVSNVSKAREAVATARKEKADFVKVYSRLGREEYFAIAEECQKRNLVFCGHVPNAVSAREASEAGQKSIEHLTGILMSVSKMEQELRKQLETQKQEPENSAMHERPVKELEKEKTAAELVDSYDATKATQLFADFVKNKTWQCPTLTMLTSKAYISDPKFIDDPRLKYMPPSLRSSWNSKRNSRSSKSKREDYAIAKPVYENLMEVVESMNQAGVRFLAGTDTFNPFCFPGFSLHDELELLVHAGLTPAQALQAATRNAAEYSNKLDSFGSVEKGKIADLLVLDGNPLEDINNTRKISSVIYGGKVFDRAALDQMLADVEKRAKHK